jgi:hypothetical protein
MYPIESDYRKFKFGGPIFDLPIFRYFFLYPISSEIGRSIKVSEVPSSDNIQYFTPFALIRTNPPSPEKFFFEFFAKN